MQYLLQAVRTLMNIYNPGETSEIKFRNANHFP